MNINYQQFIYLILTLSYCNKTQLIDKYKNRYIKQNNKYYNKSVSAKDKFFSNDLSFENKMNHKKSYITPRDEILNFIDNKYKIKYPRTIKGSVAGYTLFNLTWILTLIRDNKIHKEDYEYLISKIKTISNNLVISKKINNEEVDFTDIDSDIFNTKIKNTKNNLKLLFKNLKKVVAEPKLLGQLKKIEVNLFDLNQIKPKNNKPLSFKQKVSIQSSATVMTPLIYRRGIVSQNKKWWKINDLFYKDKSGNFLFEKCQRIINKPLYPLYIFDKKIYVVVDNNFIKQLLDQSPDIMDVGLMKKTFFSSFMPKNVGISSNPEWYYRRELNEYALCTDKLHKYVKIFNNSIKNELEILQKINKIPKNQEQLYGFTKHIVGKIVFNDPLGMPDSVFKMLAEGNRFRCLLIKNYKINSKIKNEAYDYFIKNIKNPKPNSLLELAVEFTKKNKCPYNNKKYEELSNQIPHWIFTTMSLFFVPAARALLFLYNHPPILTKLVNQLKKIDPTNTQEIYNNYFLRSCILETLRLNNHLTTMLRTIRRPKGNKSKKPYYYSFDNKGQYKFKEGTQFLILANPISRQKEKFHNPNTFHPERWNKDLEKSYYSMLFSQGPQKCPGKELAIFLMQSFIYHYLRVNKYKIKMKKINTDYIEQMVNPFDIEFK